MDVVYYVAVFSLMIISMLGGAMFWLGRKFAQINERFQRLEKGLEEVKGRLANVEKGLEEVKAQLAEFKNWTERKFTETEEGLAGVRERVAAVEKGLEEVKGRLANVESRLVGVEGRLTEVERGLADVRSRLAGVEGRLAGVEGRLVEFEERFVSFADAVRANVVSMNSLVVEFLGLKGLLSREEVGFLSREASRLALAIRPNSITEEEVEFLRRVFSKPVEEMTVEELEKAAEIAKQWWYREGKEEAYRLFLIAWTIRTYKLIQEPREKKGEQAA